MAFLDAFAFLGLFLLVCIALSGALAIGLIGLLHRLGLYDPPTLPARLDVLRTDVAVTVRDASPHDLFAVAAAIEEEIQVLRRRSQAAAV